MKISDRILTDNWKILVLFSRQCEFRSSGGGHPQRLFWFCCFRCVSHGMSPWPVKKYKLLFCTLITVWWSTVNTL